MVATVDASSHSCEVRTASLAVSELGRSVGAMQAPEKTVERRIAGRMCHLKAVHIHSLFLRNLRCYRYTVSDTRIAKFGAATSINQDNGLEDLPCVVVRAKQVQVRHLEADGDTSVNGQALSWFNLIKPARRPSHQTKSLLLLHYYARHTDFAPLLRIAGRRAATLGLV